MREIKLPLSKAKQSLLDAAESLFAERGFEAISVRDVTQQANANVAAINYHFGTREGLVRWVVERHLVPINDERLARLEYLERKGGAGKAAPVEEIVEALVRPVATLVRKAELSERLCCQLLGRIFALPSESLSQAMNDQKRSVTERFARALGKSLPSLAPDELLVRLHWVVGALIHLLIEPDATRGAPGALAVEVTLSRFIRFACGGLREGVEHAGTAHKKGPQSVFDFR